MTTTHNARETRRPHPKFLAIPRYSWFFRVLPNCIGLLFRRRARNSPHMRDITHEQTRRRRGNCWGLLGFAGVFGNGPLPFRHCARNSPHMRGTTNEQTRGCRRGAEKCARWCALRSVGAGSDRARLMFHRCARNSPHMRGTTNEQTRGQRGNCATICSALRCFAVLCGNGLLQSRSRARNSRHMRGAPSDQLRGQRGKTASRN